MNVFKRSWLAVVRQKSKSLILLLILFALGVSVLSSFALHRGVSSVEKSLSNKIGKSFTVENNLDTNLNAKNRGYGNFDENDLQEVLKTPGITHYRATMVAQGRLKNLSMKEIESENMQLTEEVLNEIKNVTDLKGVEDTSRDPKFISGLLTLKEGRHIEKGDEGKVLIHEDFAKRNHLTLGSKVSFTPVRYIDQGQKYQDNGADTSLEVVGIFKGDNPKPAMYASELTENLFLTDLNTTAKVRGFDKNNRQYQEVTFYTDANHSVESVVKNAKKQKVNWSLYNIYTSDKALPAMTKSMSETQKLIKKFSIGTIGMSLIVLVLILGFWMRQRLRETGILLSLGKSKLEILGQYLLETFYLAIPSFILSSVVSQQIAKKVGNSFIQQAKTAVLQNQQSQLGGLSIGADADSQALSQTISNLNTSLSTTDLLLSLGIGCLVIALAVSVASYFMLRLKPKEILTKMS